MNKISIEEARAIAESLRDLKHMFVVINVIHNLCDQLESKRSLVDVPTVEEGK